MKTDLGRTPDTRAARARDIIVRDILGHPVTEADREAVANWIASARRGGESRPFNLRKEMEKRGITTYAMAAHLGVSRQSIKDWRMGYKRPSKEMAVLIADELKMPRLRVVTGLAGRVRTMDSPAVNRKYDPTEPMTGHNLAAARRKVGLTQCQLAELAGVTVDAVYCWERGKSCPSKYLQEIQKVVRARLGK